MRVCLLVLAVFIISFAFGLAENSQLSEDYYEVLQPCPHDCDCTEPWNVQCYSIAGVEQLTNVVRILKIYGECSSRYPKCIKRVEKDLLKNLTNLETLAIYDTRLQTLPDGFLDNQQNLTSLELRGNPIIFHLSSSVFSKLRNLTSLYIIESNSVFLNGSLFYGLENLQVLELRNNFLRCFPHTIFNSLPSLKYLGLNGNKLRNFSYSPTVNETGKLEYINLEDNQIEFLSNDAFKNLTSLKELNLKGNNLQCSCQMFELIMNLVGSNTYVEGKCDTFNFVNNSTQQFDLTQLPDEMLCPNLFDCEVKHHHWPYYY